MGGYESLVEVFGTEQKLVVEVSLGHGEPKGLCIQSLPRRPPLRATSR
jgi:hypothetical protein